MEKARVQLDNRIVTIILSKLKTVERKGKGTCTYFVWNMRVVRAGGRVRRLGVRAKEGESFCVLDGESF